MMKKITFLLVFLLLGTFTYAQNFTFFFDSDTIQQNTSIGTHIDFKGHVVNNTTANSDSKWEILNVNFPASSWQFYVCDDNLCYAPMVASKVQNVRAGDTSLVKVTMIAGTSGIGTLTARVSEVANPNVTQEYTLMLDATVATHELASVVVFSQNAPNPFNDFTIVKYDLKGNDGRILVTDAAGRQVNEYLLNASQGEVEIGSNLQSGLYFYSLMVDGRVVTTKRLQKM